MRRFLACVLLVAILSACGASLEYYELPTPTIYATEPPEIYATEPPERVFVTGDVNIRDEDDVVRGWLRAGDIVAATCSGDWCEITSGIFTGMRFWRGCSDDNPAGLGCVKRE